MADDLGRERRDAGRHRGQDRIVGWMLSIACVLGMVIVAAMWSVR